MTLGVCYYAAKSILDELETTEFSLGQTKIERVAIIQFRMNKCCGYCGCSFQAIDWRQNWRGEGLKKKWGAWAPWCEVIVVANK